VASDGLFCGIYFYPYGTFLCTGSCRHTIDSINNLVKNTISLFLLVLENAVNNTWVAELMPLKFDQMVCSSYSFKTRSCAYQVKEAVKH
jgi:hypothetical protein